MYKHVVQFIDISVILDSAEAAESKPIPVNMGQKAKQNVTSGAHVWP